VIWCQASFGKCQVTLSETDQQKTQQTKAKFIPHTNQSQIIR